MNTCGSFVPILWGITNASELSSVLAGIDPEPTLYATALTLPRTLKALSSVVLRFISCVQPQLKLTGYHQDKEAYEMSSDRGSHFMVLSAPCIPELAVS